MKFDFVKTAFLAAMVLFVWSCETDNVQPNAGTTTSTPTIAADISSPVSDPICSDVAAFDMLDENGNDQIQYCGFLPCNGSEGPWGTVDVYNTATDLYIDITMSFGWYLKSFDWFAGSIPASSLNNGIPQIGSDWTSGTLPVNTSSYRLSIPLNQLNGCIDLGVHFVINKLDFFSGEDPASVTDVWLSNPDWNNPSTPDENSASQYVAKWCIGSCGPVTLTLTDGECKKCDAEMTVTFNGCESIDVSSCKDLSNVVLAYTDGSWEKFDNLSGQTGSFSPTTPNMGKEISHVYIKSGCFKSGEGPGFGRRFDGPCAQ